MGQIVRRKKKGRPSEADLERRNSTSSEPPSDDKEPRRRSLRRRNVRYTFDFDDYLDDFYDDDDEDIRKREKKLKLLLKLQSSSGTSNNKGDNSESTRRVDYHAPSQSASSSESDDDDEKPSKKQKVGSDDENDDEENEFVEEIEEVLERKGEASGDESVPGTPADSPSQAAELHMPDKKTIELILDKLQKKDIYGVYAEPVDPEELPDYHDVIKNPMDFATVRRKLGNGSYSSLEQLESDVFLICSNATQYNAPDTVYHKQASSIQELARRKFQRLRDKVERSEVELKSEDKTTCSSIFPSKQAKKPFDRSVQEPVGSDFTSGAALASTGELQNGSTAARAASCERPRSDGHKAENSLFIDNNVDKGEESLPGKGFLSRLGRKPSINDENRRTTYNFSDQPLTASESIFSTFEGEAKQLVPVGLQADHSYARSLARFTATLGSVAWKVASERIEQALPAGTKFGRGWVGEYEPLPTPVLILKNCTFKEPIFPSRDPVSVKEPESVPTLEGKPLLFGTSTSRVGTRFPAKEESPRGASLDARAPILCPPGAKPSEFVSSNYRQQWSPLTNSIEPERRGSSTPSGNSVEPERKSSSTASPRGTSLDQRVPFFCSPGAKTSEFVSANYMKQRSFEPERRGSSIPSRNSVEPEKKSSSTASPRGANLDLRAPFFTSPGAKPSEFIGSNSRQKHSPSRNSFEPDRSGSLTPSGNSVEPERKSSSTASRNVVEPEGNNPSIPSRNSAEPEKRKSSLIPSRNSAEPEKKSFTHADLNHTHTHSANKNTAAFMSGTQILNGSDLPASWSAESVPKSRNLMPSASFKQPNNNGTFVREQHNGKPVGLYSNGMVTSSPNNYPNQMTQAAKYFPQQQQGLSDPVQLMKMMAEKNQHQEKPPNNSAVETQQVVALPHTASSRREDSNNAAVTAARAWMSLGAGGFKPAAENNGSHKMQMPSDSLYNGRQPQVSRFRGEFPPSGILFQPDKNNFPVHAFVPQPVRMMNEVHPAQFQNTPPMGFPQLVTADLSRFQMQMQSPWRGVNPSQMQQQRQKQESLPPDLNIGFQSVGSPGRQSSGVLVDSQQPDLALQL